jgi:hypothetical protein
MSKLNIELLKRLKTRFLRMRHPEHFDMKTIATKTDCGAAMCLIGHTLELEGYKMRVRRDPKLFLDYDFITPTGSKVKSPFQHARKALGLGRQSASALFHDWDLETPADAAERIQKIIETGKV